MQVLLISEKYAFEEALDEVLKTLALPYWHAKPFMQTWRAQRDNQRLLTPLVQSIDNVRSAQARTEQRLALLQHVEALRLYAVTHKDQLPRQLSEVQLPLPVDPVSGQPFHYTLRAGTATLQGSPLPRGEWIRYEITLAK